MKRIIMVLLVAGSCNYHEKPDPLLVEAARYHLEAARLARQLEHDLDSLIKGDVTQVDSLFRLREELQQWETELIEVPGFESEEGHDHHHHDHTPAVNLTAGQMVDIQLECLERIKSIRKRLNKFSHESLSNQK